MVNAEGPANANLVANDRRLPGGNAKERKVTTPLPLRNGSGKLI